MLWEKENTAAFRAVVGPLLTSDEVCQMRRYRRHSNGVSCYDHSVFVAYVSFRLARRLGLDYRAAARAGLLHDLTLRDWSETDVGRLRRLVVHPRVAAENAERFGISELERDIITKHMWPLTPALPRHRESFVVSFADKLCASAEMLHVYTAAHIGQRLAAPAAG